MTLLACTLKNEKDYEQCFIESQVMSEKGGGVI